MNTLTVDRSGFNALFAYLPPLRRLFEELIDQRNRATPARAPQADPDPQAKKGAAVVG